MTGCARDLPFADGPERRAASRTVHAARAGTSE